MGLTPLGLRVAALSRSAVVVVAWGAFVLCVILYWYIAKLAKFVSHFRK